MPNRFRRDGETEQIKASIRGGKPELAMRTVYANAFATVCRYAMTAALAVTTPPSLNALRAILRIP